MLDTFSRKLLLLIKTLQNIFWKNNFLFEKLFKTPLKVLIFLSIRTPNSNYPCRSFLDCKVTDFFVCHEATMCTYLVELSDTWQVSSQLLVSRSFLTTSSLLLSPMFLKPWIWTIKTMKTASPRRKNPFTFYRL